MSSHYSDSPSIHNPSSTVDIESEVEDEIDQLDSDSEMEDPEAATSNDPRAGQRTPGQSLLPSARMENIIQADGVTGDLALSKEGFFLLSVATEEFIKRMALAGHERSTVERRPTSVTYPDMAWAVKRCKELNFLVDTIPQPISLQEALILREERERGSPEPLSSTPWAAIDLSERSTSIQEDTSRHSNSVNNGVQKVNGISSSRSASTAVNGTRSHRAEELAPPRVEARSRRSARNSGDTLSASASRASPLANGHAPSLPRSQTITPNDERLDLPHPPHPHYQTSVTPPYHHDEPPWPGHFTGPASGFLQGPAAPFGRPPQNTGRTIYSQNDHPD